VTDELILKWVLCQPKGQWDWGTWERWKVYMKSGQACLPLLWSKES